MKKTLPMLLLVTSTLGLGSCNKDNTQELIRATGANFDSAGLAKVELEEFKTWYTPDAYYYTYFTTNIEGTVKKYFFKEGKNTDTVTYNLYSGESSTGIRSVDDTGYHSGYTKLKFDIPNAMHDEFYTFDFWYEKNYFDNLIDTTKDLYFEFYSESATDSYWVRKVDKRNLDSNEFSYREHWVRFGVRQGFTYANKVVAWDLVKTPSTTINSNCDYYCEATFTASHY